MKRNLSLLIFALLATILGNAQAFRNVSGEDLEKHFFSNPDVMAFVQRQSVRPEFAARKQPPDRMTIVVKDGKRDIRAVSPVLDEGSGTYIVSNAGGTEEIFAVSFKGKDSVASSEISLSMVKSLTSGAVTVWAQVGENQYNAVKGERGRAEIVKMPLPSARGTVSKITSCFNAFKKSGGPANCSNCFSCLSSCGTRKTRWQKISCALGSCSSSCWACVTSVYRFVVCVF